MILVKTLDVFVFDFTVVNVTVLTAYDKRKQLCSLVVHWRAFLWFVP